MHLNFEYFINLLIIIGKIMAEKFGEDYFYGKKYSNYSNYEKMDAASHFKSVVSFIRDNNLSGRILDVGCAFSFLLVEVSPYFLELYGLDVSRFAIEKAKEIIPEANLEVADLEKTLPYPDEFFDCITALDVLEHTNDVKGNFGKLVRKLKVDGHLIVWLPIDAWPRRLFDFLDKDETHVSILKEKELIEIVEKNDLEILSRRRYCPFPVLGSIPHVPAQIELILRKG